MPQAGANDILQTYAEQIARLMEEMKALKGDVKDKLLDAKKDGLDVKALLRVVKEMGMGDEQRQKQLEFEFTLDGCRKRVGLLTEGGKQEAA